MQMALEALETDEQWGFVNKKVLERRIPAATTLRQAIAHAEQNHSGDANEMVAEQQELVQVGWQCADCKAPVRDGYTCDVCDSGAAEERYAPKAEQQEPVMGYERLNALREGEQNSAEDDYFNARPENDTPTLRRMFCQGFERGFHKGLEYTAPQPSLVGSESGLVGKQEPVAWMFVNLDGECEEIGYGKDYLKGSELMSEFQPLYTAPQQREDWTDRSVQIRALQAIGAEWYDGKIRNQWIADTCHELTKVIAGNKPPQREWVEPSDEQIYDLDNLPEIESVRFARAVLKLAKELNT